MILDAQEYINELKTYKRYVLKKQDAINRYNDIEVKLQHLSPEYVSPGYVSMVEVKRYVKGRIITKLVPMPKLDPDPTRREAIRRGLIDEQCDLENEINYYKRKIASIKETSDLLPESLRKLCWDVYVHKRIGKISRDFNYSKAAIYGLITEELDDILKVQRSKKSGNSTENT